MTKLSSPSKVIEMSLYLSFVSPEGEREVTLWWWSGIANVILIKSFNSNLMNMNKVSLNVFESRTVSQESPSSLIVAVFAHVGGPHRGRVVIPDERQHYYQRLHWSHTQGLERRDRRMYPHPLWAYLNSALHAPTWEKVWGELTSEPFCPLLCETRAFGEDCI